MKRKSLASPLLLAAFVAPLAMAEPLTLKSAVDIALKNNPTVRAAREKKVEADATTSGLISHLFPAVDLKATTNYRKDSTLSGKALFGGEAYNDYALQLSLVQPIYAGGAILSGLSSARADERLRTIESDIAERDLILSVLEAWQKVQLQQKLLDTLNRTNEVQRSILTSAQARVRIGRSQLLDVLQIKTDIALLQPRIAEARNNIEIAAAELANLLSVKIHEITLSPNPILPDAEHVAKTIGSRKATLPEIEHVMVEHEEFEGKRDVFLAKHYPQVNGLANWGRSAYSKGDLLNGYSTAWNIGLSIDVPIFSGLAFFADRRSIASQGAQVEIEEARVREKAALDEIRSRKNLDLARNQIAASSEAAELALESFKEAQKNYRLQTIDTLQFLKSEEALISAEFDREQQKFNYIDSLAKYYVASGLPLMELVGLLAGG